MSLAFSPAMDASRDGRARSARTAVVLSSLLAVLAFGTFLPALRNGFVAFDDDLYVTENRHVQAGVTSADLRWAWTTLHAGYWQPLTWMSLQLDAQVYSARAWGYHLSNCLWHAANAVLFFWVLRAFTGSTWRSAAAAALFAVHPLRVESVAWVTERKDVLSTFWGLAALLAYRAYVACPSLVRYGLVAAALTLGLMAKPMLVSWPVLLLLLDDWPLRRWRPASSSQSDGVDGRPPAPTESWTWLILEKVPLLAIALASAILTVYAQQRAQALLPLERVPLEIRLGNAVLAYGWYLGTTVWPVGLAPFYPHPRLNFSWTHVAATASVLVAVSALVAGMRSRPYLRVGWLWFLIATVPVLGLIQAGEQPWADRFTYVPQMGLLLLLVWSGRDLLAGARAPTWVCTAMAGSAVAACVPLTWIQASRWQDTVTLMEYTLAVTRDNPVAHNTIGSALLQRRPEAAAAHFREAIRLDPQLAKAHYNLGLALAALQRVDDAIAAYEQALAVHPDFVPAHFNLATLLAQLHRTGEAIPHFRRALEVDPNFAAAHYNLALALVSDGRPAEADHHFTAAVQLEPEFARQRFQIGFLLAAHRQPAQAVEHYRAALRDRPDSGEIYYHLGCALAALDQWPEAIDALRMAGKLQFASAYPRAAVAWALRHQGQESAAQAEYDRVVRMDPQWPQTAARKAWSMATNVDPLLRNGPWALALAEQAVHLTNEQDPAVLDALAAAWAEVGRFDRAVTVARKAQALAGAQRSALAAPITARLRLYEQGQPFREVAQTKGP
jgi:tetratricopeptide (TPR) repeat protein